VTEAQARDTQVQRLADVVAGRFCYSVMAASAATFAFWHLAGTGLFPQVRASARAPPQGPHWRPH
jgi:Cu2+-exporting ATPase